MVRRGVSLSPWPIQSCHAKKDTQPALRELNELALGQIFLTHIAAESVAAADKSVLGQVQKRNQPTNAAKSLGRMRAISVCHFCCDCNDAGVLWTSL